MSEIPFDKSGNLAITLGNHGGNPSVIVYELGVQFDLITDPIRGSYEE